MASLLFSLASSSSSSTSRPEGEWIEMTEFKYEPENTDLKIDHQYKTLCTDGRTYTPEDPWTMPTTLHLRRKNCAPDLRKRNDFRWNPRKNIPLAAYQPPPLTEDEANAAAENHEQFTLHELISKVSLGVMRIPLHRIVVSELVRDATLNRMLRKCESVVDNGWDSVRFHFFKVVFFRITYIFFFRMLSSWSTKWQSMSFPRESHHFVRFSRSSSMSGRSCCYRMLRTILPRDGSQ